MRASTNDHHHHHRSRSPSRARIRRQVSAGAAAADEFISASIARSLRVDFRRKCFVAAAAARSVRALPSRRSCEHVA